MRAIPALLLSLALTLIPLATLLAQPPPDPVAAIRRLLAGTFEKPESPLSLAPIVVEGDAAIVGWIQGDLAGRAFLRKASGQWAIVACGGDALKSPETLQRLGLPQAQAEGLASSLVEAEPRLDPMRVARFASFGDLVEMGGHIHPPAPGHR